MHSLLNRFFRIRSRTTEITAALSTEDHCIQPFPEASPPKWHLGHTTWFFETLVLNKYFENYHPFNPSFHQLFNSYYNSLGPHGRQSERGTFSRPTVNEILSYRNHVDEHMGILLKNHNPQDVADLVTLGLHHEQQHQELLYMDIKGIYFHQSPSPTFSTPLFNKKLNMITHKKYQTFQGGLVTVGYAGNDFCYDNESPQHKYFLQPFRLRTSLVSNAEYREFIHGGGYENPELWLSDGWDWVQTQNHRQPLYWVQQEHEWYEYDLDGLTPLHPHLPVRHINYYEASAFARFHNKRLPTEFEWEYATTTQELDDAVETLWQWTRSAYLPYPGHHWRHGPLGEYNSKFMVNQMVLRGGSAWTPENHVRLSYRNYFQPDKKWPFTGIRLAEDL